jgi:hypothetical protein
MSSVFNTFFHFFDFFPLLFTDTRCKLSTPFLFFSRARRRMFSFAPEHGKRAEKQYRADTDTDTAADSGHI